MVLKHILKFYFKKLLFVENLVVLEGNLHKTSGI